MQSSIEIENVKTVVDVIDENVKTEVENVKTAEDENVKTDDIYKNIDEIVETLMYDDMDTFMSKLFYSQALVKNYETELCNGYFLENMKIHLEKNKKMTEEKIQTKEKLIKQMKSDNILQTDDIEKEFVQLEKYKNTLENIIKKQEIITERTKPQHYVFPITEDILHEKIQKQQVLIGDMRKQGVNKEKVDNEIIVLREYKRKLVEYMKNNVNKESGDLVLKFHENQNGIIYEKQSGKIVCANQDFIEELHDIEDLENIKIRSVEYCEDGTIVRLYNYKNEWCTATTKCISGKDAYWSSSKNFDELFWEVFDKNNLEQLDVKYTYVFVLIHVENRLVVPHFENKIVYLSKINNSTLLETESNETQYREFSFVDYPEIIENFDVQVYKNGWYFRHGKRGILVKSESCKLYRLDYNVYKELKEIRGNTPNIMYRYIELLKDDRLLYILELNYPEFKFSFDVVKHSLNQIINEIYTLYVDSHIKKIVQVYESDIYFKTLKQLHGQYKRTKKAITFDDVKYKVFSLDKKIIRQFLGWYK